jgi:hypothetical protein
MNLSDRITAGLAQNQKIARQGRRKLLKPEDELEVGWGKHPIYGCKRMNDIAPH